VYPSSQFLLYYRPSLFSLTIKLSRSSRRSNQNTRHATCLALRVLPVQTHRTPRGPKTQSVRGTLGKKLERFKPPKAPAPIAVMDCAPPRGASFDAVGQRWLAVFAFQAAFSAAASALHLTVSPRGRRHPLLGVPTGLLLGFHPFLACAATGMLALALLLSVSPHPRPTPLPRRALATALFAAAGALCVGAAAAMLPEDAGWAAVAGLGFRGAVLGAIFAARYFGRRRWLLQFPVVQVSRVDWAKLWFLIVSYRKQFGVF
jgi:hypothetical protein